MILLLKADFDQIQVVTLPNKLHPLLWPEDGSATPACTLLACSLLLSERAREGGGEREKEGWDGLVWWVSKCWEANGAE